MHGSVPVVSNPPFLQNTLLTFIDKSKHYDRSEFWRAYTASMIFQVSGVKKSLAEGEDQVVTLVALLYQLQSVSIEDHSFSSLKSLLSSAKTLAAELKCQRPVYEVDHSICIGDPYDDTTMVDISFCDDEESEQRQMVVTGIIAKGVVKRPFPGSPDVDAQLAKARVKVAFYENDRILI
jgi:hypothetical protein